MILRPFCLWLAIFALALSACSSGAENGQGSAAATAIPEIEVPARWAAAQASSYQSLVDATGVVFIGTVMEERGTVERTPGLSDLKARLPVSRFELRVDSSIIGEFEAGDVVTIEQPGGLVRQGEGNAVVVLEDDELLTVGATYLFFAGVKESGALSSPPFGRFKIEDDRIRPLDDWADTPVARDLAGDSVVEGAASIRGAGD